MSAFAAPSRREVPLRVLAVGVVAVALALAGIANAFVRPARQQPVAPTLAAMPAIDLGTSVSSAAWYCPGPLPVGAGAPASEIEIDNLATEPVKAQVAVHGTRGVLATSTLAVDVHATASVALPSTGERSEAAVTVLVNRSGVGVEEAVAGQAATAHGAARPPMVSPCLPQTAASSYLVSGGSQGGNNLDLALYDPGATPSVANVALATPAGPQTPPSLQGVPVGAGSLVVLDVGRALPGQSVIAATVTASGGPLATGAEVTMVRGEGIATALQTAALVPARRWSVPPVPSGAHTSEQLALYDPGKAAASVTLELIGSGAAIASATVPAGGVVSLAPASASTPFAQRAEEVVVNHGGAVVVAREVAAAARPAEPSTAYRTVTLHQRERVHGRLETVAVTHRQLLPAGPAQPTLLPALPAGTVVSSGITAPSRRFVLPAGSASPATGELLELANETASPATVVLSTIAPTGKGRAVLSGLDHLVVPAHGTLSVALAGLVHPPGPAPLDLYASEPVTAGALFYATGAHASGLAMATGLPVENGG